MILRENLERIVEELFPDREVAQFSTDWILNSPRATEDSVREVYRFLKGKGLEDSKIFSRADLLGMNPETIERNYRHHVSLLRENYEDRFSGRDILTNQAQLLGISPETINANVQFLHSRGINYNNAFLLGTTHQLKRQKMAWMLRELFDYRSLPQEKRRGAINGLYDFIRDEPRVLTKSINSMEKSKYSLRERVAQYI